MRAGVEMMMLTPIALEALKEDIRRIEDELLKKENLKDLHLEIDAKYQRFFPDWGKGMRSFSPSSGFVYAHITNETTMEHNLKMMVGKLKGLEIYPHFENGNGSSTNISPVFYNSVEVDIEITFNDARTAVENMTGLTESDVQEALEKINELEDIIKSEERKTKKWDSAKEIIKWMADKSVDVGITLLPLLLKIK